MPINLIDCAKRGFTRADEELPALSLYGWALANLDHEPGTWDEEAIHVSDYRYSLCADEGGCDRQLWHRIRQDESEDPSLWERVMWQQGWAMQLRYTWLIVHGLPDPWALREIEMNVSEGLPSNDIGSCDLVLESDERVLGVEIKTQRGNAFRYADFPKDSHKIQAQGEQYALRNLFPDKEVSQLLLYCDREGQNPPEVYPVKHDPERVELASAHVNEVGHNTNPNAPNVLDPIIEVRENKSKNSIYLSQPWVCDYCEFRGPSCPGALPDHLTELGIVAKGDHHGDFDLKTGEEVMDEVEEKIRNAADSDNIKTK